MANTIPISSIVQVNPGVLSAAGSAIDLNGLILTQSTYVPIGQVQNFPNAAAVGNLFGLSSTEYAMATVYFSGITNGTKAPGNLLFAQYPENAVAGYLIGAPIGSIPLATLQSYTGTISLTVSGTVFTSSTISLAAATSFSSAATIIAAGFTAPTFSVSFDPVRQGFLFTNTSTGSASTITFATGSLATSLLLTSTTGAQISQGDAAATPAAFMAGILSVTQNWATFTTTWTQTVAEQELFALWTSSQAPRYAYAAWGTDPNALIANNTSTLGYYIAQNSIQGVVAIYGDYTHGAFVLSFAASLDFSRTNGRATAAFKRSGAVLPAVNTAIAAQTLQQAGYSFYGTYASATQTFNFWYNGSISGQYLWLDSYLDEIWLTANLQLSMVNLLLNVGSIPYNNQGYGLIQAAVQDTINTAVNFGAIRTGVNLSQQQLATIQFAIQKDVSSALSTKGWYLSITPATPAQRIARASPSMTLYYVDGGSIQALTLAAIELQ